MKQKQSRVLKKLKRVTIIIILLLSSLYMYNSIMTGIDAEKHPAIGNIVDIGTHSLHYIKKGEGDFPIILDAGLPGTCLDYIHLIDELSEFSQVLAYDRAGYGWSEPGPEPRTSLQIVSELHQLLSNINIKKPYILVGHSFGGLNMLLYTYTYPEEVAALVLIDATHPEYRNTLPEDFANIEKSKTNQLKLGSIFSPFGIHRILNISLSPYEMPDHLRDAANAMGSKASVFKTAYNEFSVIDKSIEQLQHIESIGNIPLVVLMKGKETPPIKTFTKEQMLEYENGLELLQKKFLSLSSQSELIVAENSGHFIHYDQPKFVIRSIRELIFQITNKN